MPDNQQQSWSRRNWKWLVPVGCLTPIVVCSGLLTVIFSSMKSSEPYGQALAKAQGSREVIQALGEPIDAGFLVSGEIHVDLDGTGNANFAIPISGPQGSAVLNVVAKKEAGMWSFQQLNVAVERSDKRIDLLADESEGGVSGTQEPASQAVKSESQRGTSD